MLLEQRPVGRLARDAIPVRFHWARRDPSPRLASLDHAPLGHAPHAVRPAWLRDSPARCLGSQLSRLAGSVSARTRLCRRSLHTAGCTPHTRLHRTPAFDPQRPQRSQPRLLSLPIRNPPSRTERGWSSSACSDEIGTWLWPFVSVSLNDCAIPVTATFCWKVVLMTRIRFGD